MKRWDTIAGGKPRAPRFQLQLALYYRQRHQAQWLEGTTLNISRSGLLFQAQAVIPPKSDLEVRLVLPLEEAVEIVCAGEVVRTEEPGAEYAAPLVAARIADFAFRRDFNAAAV